MVRKKSILKDAIRKIFLNKKMFISLLLIIIVGSGIYVGLKVTPEAMEKNARNYYKETNLFDLKITSTIGFSSGDKHTLKQIDGVKGVSFVKTLDVLASVNNEDYVIKLNSISSDRSLKNEDYINHLTLTSGKYPSTINEGLVEESFLQDNNLKLGDLVTLNPDNDEDLKAKKIKIVGTVKSSYYSSKDKGLSNENNATVDYVMFLEENDFSNSTYNEAFITIKDANKYDTYGKKYENIVNKYKETINEKVSEITKASYEANTSALNDEIANLEEELNELNQTDLPVESLGDMVKQITEELKSKTEELSEIDNYNTYIATRNNTPSFYEYKLEIEKIKSISKIFPFMFFLVSTIVSLTIIKRIIDEEKVQIGMLRAMGYGKIDIMFKYVLYAFLISFLGSIIGGLLFYKIIPLLVGFGCNAFYQMPAINASLQIKYILIVTLLSCLITTLITILSFINLFRKTPSELMKPKTPKKNKKIFLEKLTKFWNRLSFLNKVTFKNVFRYKKRFLLTTLAICGSAALILASFGIKDSISSTPYKQFNKVNKYDILLNFSQNIENDEKDNATNSVTINKSIKDLGLFSNLLVSVKNKNNSENVRLIIPSNQKEINKFITLKSSDNKKEIKLNNDGVIISEKLAEILNVQKNDKVEITLNNKKIKVKVEGITKNYIDHYVYMSPSLYEELSSEEVNYNSIFINTKKLSKDEEANLMSYLSEIKGVKSVELTRNTKENYEQMMSSLNYVIIILIICSSVLSFLALYNLLRVNISERLKELADLKALGFYDKEIAKYFYKETFIISLVGTTIGIILGSFLTNLVIKTCSTTMFVFSFKISFISYLLTLIIMFILSLVVSALIHFEFKKMDLATILKD